MPAEQDCRPGSPRTPFCLTKQLRADIFALAVDNRRSLESGRELVEPSPWPSPARRGNELGDAPPSRALCTRGEGHSASTLSHEDAFMSATFRGRQRHLIATIFLYAIVLASPRPVHRAPATQQPKQQPRPAAARRLLFGRRSRRGRNPRAAVDGAISLAARKKPAARHAAGPRLWLSCRTRLAR